MQLEKIQIYTTMICKHFTAIDSRSKIRTRGMTLGFTNLLDNSETSFGPGFTRYIAGDHIRISDERN
jgi:hypothetical protein